MWEVLGADNAPAVHGLIAAAATTVRKYCGQLQNLALLSRSRRLLEDSGGAQGGAQAANALAVLLEEEPALALARDFQGRSLWHDLATGEHVCLLRRLLLLLLLARGADGGKQPQGDTQQGGQPQQQQRQHVLSGEVNPLNLADATGDTPLHLAAAASSVEAAQLLIEARAALDNQNRCGLTRQGRAGQGRELASRHLGSGAPLHASPPVCPHCCCLQGQEQVCWR